MILFHVPRDVLLPHVRVAASFAFSLSTSHFSHTLPTFFVHWLCLVVAFSAFVLDRDHPKTRCEHLGARWECPTLSVVQIAKDWKTIYINMTATMTSANFARPEDGSLENLQQGIGDGNPALASVMLNIEGIEAERRVTEWWRDPGHAAETRGNFREGR